jgi:hypothetical protein
MTWALGMGEPAKHCMALNGTGQDQDLYARFLGPQCLPGMPP